MRAAQVFADFVELLGVAFDQRRYGRWEGRRGGRLVDVATNRRRRTPRRAATGMGRRVDQTVFAAPASSDRLRHVMSSGHGEPSRIGRARTAPSPCAVVIADTRKLISEALGALIGAMTGC